MPVTPSAEAPRPTGSALRSALAVFAGYIVMAVVMMVLYTLWPNAPRVLSAREFHVLGVIIGCTAAVAGGYATASLVPGRETVHALVLVLVTVAMEMVQYAVAKERSPFSWWTLSVASAVLGIMIGSTARRVLPRGYLVRWIRRRR